MINLSLLSAAQQIKDGKISATEIVKQTISQVHNTQYNAILSLFEEDALIAAKKIDQGDKSGVLAGVPIIIKDNIDCEGKPTTCASAAMRSNIALKDADVVKKLRAEGAIILGKANMDEFAMGSANATSAFGRVFNPINKEHVPGGSSGGSACAVATKQCFASLGTDTGGSIRQPASYCGVVGLKPTHGSVSSQGCFPLAPSLDQIGPFARNVSDCAAVFGVIATGDRSHEFSNILPQPKRVLMIKELYSHMSGEIFSIIQKAASKLERGGCTITEVSVPSFVHAHFIYKTFAYAQMSQSLSAIKKDRNLLGHEVKKRIIAGRYILDNPAILDKAKILKHELSSQLLSVLNDADVLLLPTVPSAAFRFDDDPSKPEIEFSDTFSLPASIVGLPSLNMPFAKDKNEMPIGVQIVAKAGREIDAFCIGKILE